MQRLFTSENSSVHLLHLYLKVVTIVYTVYDTAAIDDSENLPFLDSYNQENTYFTLKKRTVSTW
jgi:hypothetical protein